MSSNNIFGRLEKLRKVASQTSGLTFRTLTHQLSQKLQALGESTLGLGSVHRGLRGYESMCIEHVRIVASLVADALKLPTDDVIQYVEFNKIVSKPIARLVNAKYFPNTNDEMGKAYRQLLREFADARQCSIVMREVQPFMVTRDLECRIPRVRELSDYYRMRVRTSSGRLRSVLNYRTARRPSLRINLFVARGLFDGIHHESRRDVEESFQSNASTWDMAVIELPSDRLPLESDGPISSASVLSESSSLFRVHRESFAWEVCCSSCDFGLSVKRLSAQVA